MFLSSPRVLFLTLTMLVGVLGLATTSGSHATKAPDKSKKPGAVAVPYTWPETGTAAKQPTRHPQQQENLKTFALEVFEPALPFAPCGERINPAHIYAQFGRTQGFKTWSEPHPDASHLVNLFAAWHYGGLTFVTLTGASAYGLSTWLRSITLASPDHPLQFGLKIGLPYSAFIEKLGEPDPYQSAVPYSLVYEFHSISIKLETDEQRRVSKLSLRCVSTH